MNTLIQVVQDIVMTGQTVIHVKKVINALVDVIRVWVRIRVNIFVTVLAGILTMNRDMKLLGTDKPGGPSQPRNQCEKTQCQRKYQGFLGDCLCEPGCFLRRFHRGVESLAV
jgi:hypothetical protein